MKRLALKRWIPWQLAALVVSLNVAWPQRAQAGSATWNQTAAGTYEWGTVTNWNPNTTFPNGSTDNASINNDIAGNIIINLATGTAANRTVNDLNLGDSSGTSTFTIAAGVTGSTLIFAGSRTMDVTGAGANTISAGVRVSGGAMTFRSTSTAETTISGVISNDGTNRNLVFNRNVNGVTSAAVNNQGQFSLTAANTAFGTTGSTTITDVRVRGTVAGAFGANAANSVNVAGAGQVYLTGGTHVNNLVLNSTGWGETAGNLGALRIENSTVSGTVALQRDTIIGVNANVTGTLSGVISGSFGITKVGGTTTSGQGELLLSGANTFTGPVTVDRGSIRASNASALGTGTTVTVNASPTAGGDGNRLAISGGITIGSGKTLTLNSNGTGDFRSMLISTANSNTWAGNIVAAGTGLAQISAASNSTLTVTGGITSTGGGGGGTLFSRGAGTVNYNGVINLGTDRKFSKTDAGTAIVNSTGNSWTQTQVANGQIQIGANDALATGANFIFGENNANNGRLELNGFSQTVGGIATFGTSTGTGHILRNSNLSTASTLTFATPTATTDLLKSVQVHGTASGLGTLHMVSNGLGRTEFQDGLVAANSWTVNSGTVAFTGGTSRILPGSVTGAVGAIIEKAGASTLAAQSTWNNAGTTNITGGTLVLGNGTSGAVNVSDGATLSTGLNGGVLNASAVTFGTAGATNYAPILTSTSAPAPLNAAALTTSGTTVTIVPQAGAFTTGTYRLLDYTGSVGGNGTGGFALGPVGTYPHMTATLDTATAGQVNLAVSAVDSLIWAGQTSNTWDVNTTSNFALASSPSTGAAFYQGDAVAFNDTQDVTAPGTPVTNSTITGGAVTIGNLSFNNSAVTYSVANPLTGAGGVSKSGTGTTTLSGANTYAGVTSVSNGTLVLSGANTLAGNVNVTGGTLKIGNADALRGVPKVIVSGGGTFDANGITTVTNRFTEIEFSGTGVGGNGAIINSGAGFTNNSHFAKYTMAGNATWGGSGRYDIVASQTFNGGAFTLTKTGAGELWYNPSAGSVLENVIVNGGVFGSQGNNPLSATATVTVNNGGTHQFYSAITNQHNVALNDGGILRSTNSTPTLTGQLTLNGTDANRFLAANASTTLNIAGKITGTGGLTKTDNGILQLQNAANDYAGDTVINAGTLNFNAAGVLPATTDLVFGGGTLDPVNRTHTVASISGTSGSINQGTAGTGVVVSTQMTNTVFNGTVNRVNVTMSGTGSLTLGGTADNVAGNAIVNSGTLILAKGNTAQALQAVHAVATGGLTINGGTAQLGGSYDNINNLGTAVNLAPGGIDTGTYVDQIYNAVGVALNGGTFDLNGRQEAINTLTNPAGAGGTVTNTAAATAAKLYIGHQNGASTFGGAINDGAGTVAIEKIGTGALTLTGTSNFTGGLTQTAGTVTVPTGAVLGNTPITVTANTFSFDGTHGTGAIALNGTSSFVGAGTSGGALTAASGTTLQVGTASAGTTATTLTLGGLTLGGGVNLNLDFTGSAIDKVATTVTNGLNLSGANPLNVTLGTAGWVSGTYPILTYAGTVQGSGASNSTLVLSTPVGHSTVNVVDDTAGTVNLVVTSTPNKWVGGNGNAWDTNSTLNWNAGDQLFLTGDTVVFDDTATTFTPNISANQTPSGVTFDNTTAQSYTLTSTGAFGIAGPGGLIKKNTGTVTISSANTYTGPTEVQAGTLIANYNNGTATTVFNTASSVSVAAGATLKVVADDANFTFANNLTGSGTVVIDPHATAGAATREVVISGNNAGFTGTLRLSPTVIGDGSGTFRTNTPLTPAGAGGAAIDVDAGAQAWLAAGTFANNFTITGHGFMESAGGTPVAASGLTLYSNATTKAGIGALRLSSNTIISGSVTLDGSAKVGPYGATGTISGSIFITNPTDVLSVGGGGSANTLILTGTNNVGTNALKDILVNAGGTAGANTLSIGNGGTTGTLGAGAVSLNGDGAQGLLRFDRSDGYTLAAANTITSSGTNTGNTGLRIDTTGTGFDQNEVAINLGSGSFQVGTQAGRANAIATIDGNLTVGSIGIGTAATGATLNIQAGANIVNSGNFFLGEQNGFSGTVNQTGGAATAGTHMRVGHWPNNTSVYNISAGTLSVAANPSIALNPAGGSGAEQNGGIYLGEDGTGILNQSGGTVTTDWVVLDNRGNNGPGTNQPDGIDRYNLSGGTLELRGQYGIHNRNATTEFNFSGGTIKNVGSGVNVGISAGSGGTGNGTFVLGTDGTPTFDTNGATNTITVSRDLSGTGSLTKISDGLLVLSAANTYSGATAVNGGTLQLGAAGTTGSLNTSSAISVGTGAIFAVNQTDAVVQGTDFSGAAITGNGGFTQAGAGSTTLNAANTYAGATTVSAGSLIVSHNSALGTTAGGTTVASGASLQLGSGIVVTGETATISGNGGASFGGALRTLTGASAEWAGTVILGDAAARVGASAGTTLTISGAIQDGAGTNLFVTGESGTGEVVLSGANTYTGSTNIIRGTLKIGAADSLPTGTILDVDSTTAAENATFDLNGFDQTVGALQRTGTGGTGASFVTNSSATLKTLTVNQAANTTYSGVIQGNLALTKSGTGTLTLSGTNTYTGATTVNNGRLQVDGSLTSAVTVNSGGTLGGNGSTGDLTVTSGGALSPGASPGLLTTGSVTTASGSFTNIEIGGLTAITQYDRISTAGTISLDGTLVVSFNFPGAQQGDTFDIWLNDGPDAITGTFAGLPEGASIPAGMGTLMITYLANADAGTVGNDIRLTYVPEPSSGALALGAALLLNRRRRAK